MNMYQFNVKRVPTKCLYLTLLVLFMNIGSNNNMIGQNVGIGTTTPIVTLDVLSNNSYVSRFNCSTSNMFIGLNESNELRGYIGSYSGAASDVDFGTASSNLTGKLHLAIKAAPQLTIDQNGNVGMGTMNPNSSAKLEINSTNKGFLPPRMTTAQRNSITNPAEGLMIYNTNTKKPNYYDGARWRVFDGSDLEVGEPYQGGIIAYFFEPGDPGYVAGQDHGLIAAASDQGTDVYWAQGCTLWCGTSTGIGTGNQNTTSIISSCGSSAHAANLCSNLVLNGYSDWYLPSQDELNKLFINKDLIGGFASDFYWSSSECIVDSARNQYFSNGSQWCPLKIEQHRVRAVRTF